MEEIRSLCPSTRMRMLIFGERFSDLGYFTRGIFSVCESAKTRLLALTYTCQLKNLTHEARTLQKRARQLLATTSSNVIVPYSFII